MFGNAIASSPSLTSVNLSKNPLGGYLEASGNEEYTSDADDDDSNAEDSTIDTVVAMLIVILPKQR